MTSELPGSFWRLEAPADRPALVAEGGQWIVRYGELAALADAAVAPLPPGLGLLLCRNHPTALATYLGVLRAGRPLLLLPADLPPEGLSAIIGRYRPDWIVGADVDPQPGYRPAPGPDGWSALVREAARRAPRTPSWRCSSRPRGAPAAPSSCASRTPISRATPTRSLASWVWTRRSGPSPRCRWRTATA